jgi:ferric-dicitrate binding protein FerR (iron transport regulator)
VKEKEIKRLLDKFNAGQCTPQELEVLNVLMQQLDTEAGPERQTDELKEVLWGRIQAHTAPIVKVRRLDRLWLKAAAILVVALLAALFYARLAGNRISTETLTYQVLTAPKGQMTQVIMPDNTIVKLNAGSSIRFPLAFGEKKREVFLLDGEAFFDVKHDASKPFLVHTGKVTTQVLGTSFNIKFYHELPDIQVLVQTGKVEVHDQQHTLGMYTPRQQMIYNKQQHSFVKQEVADDHLLSWLGNELILDNASFKEVAIYLQNRYNVSFRDQHQKTNPQHYSVRFSNKLTIKQVLDILQFIDGRKYRLEGNVVNIN